jgi:phosphopantetheinyl transferase
VRATDGIVHVWRADLAAAGDGLEDLLCADELARAAQIVSQHRRVSWARSRGLLRALLGRYLDRDPRTFDFVLGPHGKPSLYGGTTCVTDLRFNLSHSGRFALVAVTAGRDVGVDIECANERHTVEFLRAWVAREATVKCRGTGLAGAGGSSKDGLWMSELDVGPDAIATVAVEGEPCDLHCYLW